MVQVDRVQAPLVTITLNPALDLSAEVARVVAGRKLRTGPVRSEPGGGGINVARVVAALGGQVLALACLGGTTGQRVAAYLTDLPGLTVVPLPAPGETRESFSITETATGAQFRFVLPGPSFAPEGTEALLTALAAAIPDRAWVVLSGSQPPGLPADLPQRLARVLPAGARLLVDSSGPALDCLLAAPDLHHPPALLRLDETEAGTRAPGMAAAALARDLVARGVAQAVTVAQGAAGNVLAAASGAWSCAPPAVTVASKIGAGDSFMGALALARARGADWPEALRQGTAAAAAAVTTPGTELCRAADVARLAQLCRLGPA